MDKNAIVGAFEHQASGCFLYRTKHPMDMFRENGIDARMLQIETDIDFYDRLKSVQLYGIYPFQFYKTLETLKSDGKKIIYDLDDAFDFIDTNNPFYYAVKKDVKSSLEILKYADHITVSTPIMAEILEGKTDKPITITPNCYNPKEWTFPRPQREGIRIGFAGSCTHVEDLLMVLPAIKNLQDKHDIRFLIAGFGRETYQDWYRDFSYSATDEALKHLIEFDGLMSTIRFEWVPFVDYVSYPDTLTNMALDIGICPLKDTQFNRARSACKAMEYTLSGALAIASNLPTYSYETSSILVNDDEWEQALERYILMKDQRDVEREVHLEWLRENRQQNSQLEVLRKIYEV